MAKRNHLMIFPKPSEPTQRSHVTAIVRDLVGHGIGTHLRENPQIPNFPKRRGIKLNSREQPGRRARGQHGRTDVK